MSDAFDKLLAASARPVVKIPVRKRSQRQERKLAADIGGSAVKGSGAFAGNKGDIRSKEWAGEAKFTGATSYRLTQHELEKIELEAANLQRNFVFAVEIAGKTYAVIPWDTYRQFQDAPETPEELFKLGLL